MGPWTKTFFHSTIILFSLVGLVVFGLFVAHGLGLTNVSGFVSEARSLDASETRGQETTTELNERLTLCFLDILATKDTRSSVRIENYLRESHDWKNGYKMADYALRQTRDESLIAKAAGCHSNKQKVLLPSETTYSWIDSKEWQTLTVAFGRDKDIINQVAKETNISPRLIIGPVMGEQIRFFTSARGSFEQYFEPVKQFIHLSKFSYGVAGMKPETATFIESAIKDPHSPFYLGPNYEHLLDYPEGADIETERMNRLSNQSDHTYAYRYVALSQKMLIKQWADKGFDISEEPGVLATLYNLGFYRSKPHASPEVGGAPITIDEVTYSFGQLAEQFYWSGELADDFPYSLN